MSFDDGMKSQWNKFVKFPSKFKWKPVFANIREEDSPKIFAIFAYGFKYSLQRW